MMKKFKEEANLNIMILVSMTGAIVMVLGLLSELL